ncbi:hypothetical protein LTS18_009937, partial [Coniosporium uncinatum]
MARPRSVPSIDRKNNALPNIPLPSDRLPSSIPGSPNAEPSTLSHRPEYPYSHDQFLKAQSGVYNAGPDGQRHPAQLSYSRRSSGQSSNGEDGLGKRDHSSSAGSIHSQRSATVGVGGTLSAMEHISNRAVLSTSLQSVGILEYFDHDERPTFIVDSRSEEAEEYPYLSPVYYNPALLDNDLSDAVGGHSFGTAAPEVVSD